MELTAHFQVMWRRRQRIMLLSLLIAAAAYALSSSRPSVYRSATLMAVSSGGVAAGDAKSQQEASFLASTFARLAASRSVVADAVHRSGLAISADIASGRVKVAADADGFLTVAATGPSPDSARALAQGLSQALAATVEHREAETLAAALAPLRDQIANVESALAGLTQDAPQRAALEARHASLLASATTRELRPADSVAVVSPAKAQDGPVSPAPLRAALLAFIAALVVNAELAVLLEALSDRFPPENTIDEVGRVTGLPVLAEVPTGEGNEVVEAFRTLRANLMFVQDLAGVHTVAVVSAEPGAGKSFCAVNLAVSASELGVAVALVDGNLRSPVIHQRLGIGRAPGLSEALLGAEVGPALMHPSQYPALSVLPAGLPPSDPAGLLGGGSLQQLLGTAGAEFGVVDTPAAALFADALTVALQCDITVVVMDARSTSRRAVRRLIDDLKRVKATPVGVVINRARPSSYRRQPRRSLGVDVRAMRAASWARDGVDAATAHEVARRVRAEAEEEARRVPEEAQRRADEIVSEAVAEAARIRGAAAVKLDLAERDAADLLAAARQEAEGRNPGGGDDQRRQAVALDIGAQLQVTLAAASEVLRRVGATPTPGVDAPAAST